MSGKKRTSTGLRSIREKRFVKHLVETGEIGKSATLAGFHDPAYGSKLIKNPRIASEIVLVMEKKRNY